MALVDLVVQTAGRDLLDGILTDCFEHPEARLVAIRAAASSIASGKPSSWRQMPTTMGAFSGVSVKLILTDWTRSRKSTIEGIRARASSGGSSGGGSSRGGTINSRSPVTCSGARLV